MAMAAAAGLSAPSVLAQESPLPPQEAAPANPPPPPPAPPPRSPISDAVFAALQGQQVVFQTRTGSTIAALVLASEGDTLILAIVPRGQVAVVDKREIVDARVVLPAPTRYEILPPRPEPYVPKPPPKPLPPSTRYFGLQVGVPPGAMIDVDYHHFMAFANVSLVMPLLTSNTGTFGLPFGGVGTTHLWDFTLGAGATFRLSPSSRWQFDVFGIAGGSNWNPNRPFAQTYAMFGVGLGFHVTLDQGFTLGIKGPLLGAVTGDSGGGNSALGTFFASSFVGLPVLSLGYRF
jgi:hypothetical protein